MKIFPSPTCPSWPSVLADFNIVSIVMSTNASFTAISIFILGSDQEQCAVPCTSPQFFADRDPKPGSPVILVISAVISAHVLYQAVLRGLLL